MKHECNGLQAGMRVGLAELPLAGHVIVRHQEERVGPGKISRCDDEGCFVPLARKAGAERRCGCNAVDGPLKHLCCPREVER
ncbi:hypothetical protein D3C80_1474990 [compost metagenome]